MLDVMLVYLKPLDVESYNILPILVRDTMKRSILRLGILVLVNFVALVVTFWSAASASTIHPNAYSFAPWSESVNLVIAKLPNGVNQAYVDRVANDMNNKFNAWNGSSATRGAYCCGLTATAQNAEAVTPTAIIPIRNKANQGLSNNTWTKPASSSSSDALSLKRINRTTKVTFIYHMAGSAN
jgi:hypothetical protein